MNFVSRGTDMLDACFNMQQGDAPVLQSPAADQHTMSDDRRRYWERRLSMIS
jgi:hypothetical protein